MKNKNYFLKLYLENFSIDLASEIALVLILTPLISFSVFLSKKIIQYFIIFLNLYFIHFYLFQILLNLHIFYNNQVIKNCLIF